MTAENSESSESSEKLWQEDSANVLHRTISKIWYDVREGWVVAEMKTDVLFYWGDRTLTHTEPHHNHDKLLKKLGFRRTQGMGRWQLSRERSQDRRHLSEVARLARDAGISLSPFFEQTGAIE